MLPILYTFRRCPYAMRARSMLILTRIQCEVREILLKKKPEELLKASPKGSVPVLVLPTGQVIDESLDIMMWCMKQDDTWDIADPELKQHAQELIGLNDGTFKQNLDIYKYKENKLEAREECLKFLDDLEACLEGYPFLMGHQLTYCDLAILPFVRQFSLVDPQWFSSLQYPCLQKWLAAYLESEFFAQVMYPYALWTKGNNILLF